MLLIDDVHATKKPPEVTISAKGGNRYKNFQGSQTHRHNESEKLMQLNNQLEGQDPFIKRSFDHKEEGEDQTETHLNNSDLSEDDENTISSTDPTFPEN